MRAATLVKGRIDHGGPNMRMRKLTAKDVKDLDVKTALRAECAFQRSLVPPDPFTGLIEGREEGFTKLVETQLRDGLRPTQALDVIVRKPGRGTRPVGVLHPVDRIAFRALTDRVLAGQAPLDRSSNAYREFARAPLDTWRQIVGDDEQGFSRTPGNHDGYVVVSDLVAFYQYIDHAELRKVLVRRTGDVEAIDDLIALVESVQGRRFGLPQILHSSDRLSDISGGSIEDVVRLDGYRVSRFNDDFRILVDGYASALRAVDALGEAARRVGLLLNEAKTYTPRLSTYPRRAVGYAHGRRCCDG